MENTPQQDSAYHGEGYGCLKSFLIIGGAFVALTLVLLLIKALVF